MITLLLGLMISLPGVAIVPQNGRVTGVLRTQSGAPAPDVRVSAIPASGSPTDTAVPISLGETDQTGRFVLENVPPGRYYIVAGRIDLPTVYPGTQEISKGTVLTVAPGATVSGIEFAIPEASYRPPTPQFFPLRITQVMLPVSVIVEGDGKVPVSTDTRPATIYLTPVAGGNSLEAPLNSTSIAIPFTRGVIEEYSVRIEELSEAYVVKSMTFDSTDLSAGTLKISPATLVRTVTRTGPFAFQGILSPSGLSIVLAPAR